MKQLPIEQSGYYAALADFTSLKRKSMLICYDDQDIKELIIQRLEADLTNRLVFISPETKNPIDKNRRYVILNRQTHLDDRKYSNAKGQKLNALNMIECFIYGPIIIFDNFEGITFDFMEKLPSMLYHYGVLSREPLEEKAFIFLLDKVKLENDKAAGLFAGGVNSINFCHLNPVKVDFGLHTPPFVSKFEGNSDAADS